MGDDDPIQVVLECSVCVSAISIRQCELKRKQLVDRSIELWSLSGAGAVFARGPEVLGAGKAGVGPQACRGPPLSHCRASLVSAWLEKRKRA